MKIQIEMSEEDVKKLVLEHLRTTLNNYEITLSDVNIMVKTKHNFRSEWENGNFKATINKNI